MNAPEMHSIKEFDLNAPNFMAAAMQALNEHKEISLLVPIARADVVEKAVAAHNEYYAVRVKGKRGLLQLIRFGMLGFRTLSLWPVLNRATLLNKEIHLERREAHLVISLGNCKLDS